MRGRKWRLTLRVITVQIWIVSAIWLIAEPGFEPLIGFLTGVFTLIASLTESDSERSTDWRADIARRNRETLLKRLMQDSEALLKDPLDDVKRVSLGMEPQPDAVNPLAAMPRLTDEAAQPLRPGTTIAQVFEGCQSGLLILGAPGAGKTTLLHELAVELVKRAGWTDHAAISVIFNLASWAQEQKPLEEWLVDEFALCFQNRAYGQELVDANALLLLLDGLDEVREDARAACVNAINAYRAADRGLVQIVVCSRQAEYAQVQEHARLELDSAVLLQPLTDAQVDVYLAQGGERLAALRDVIAADDQLREWAHTPLWLSVMTVAYADQSAEDMAALMRDGAGRAQLFAQYVRRMFVHKNVRDESERRQIMHWLAWLAWQMRKRNITEFYIEELQPDWLPEEHRKNNRHAENWSFGLLFGLLFGLAFGVMFGLLIGLLVGVAFGFLSVAFGRDESHIKTAEHLQFSWSSFRHGYTEGESIWVTVLIPIISLGSGLAGGLVAGASVEHSGLLGLALMLGLLGAQLVRGLNEGLTITHLESRTAPNQGIRRSVYIALALGLPQGLIGGGVLGSTGCFFGLMGGLAEGWTKLVFGLPIGMVMGLKIGFALGAPLMTAMSLEQYGGYAVVQHLWLRHFLYRAGVAPKNYAKFLTRCTDLIFMRREGGGFRFYHLELRDYFAYLYAQEHTESGS